MKIFLVGAPGAGKNAIAENLSCKLEVAHVNYRTVVMWAKEQKDVRFKRLAGLVDGFKPFPTNLAYDVFGGYLHEFKIDKFAVDGFPKTEEEAAELAKRIPKSNKNITFVINISQELLYARLMNRLVCPHCSYLVYDSNPRSILEVMCPNCQLALIKRQDDNDSGIKYRVER